MLATRHTTIERETAAQEVAQQLEEASRRWAEEAAEMARALGAARRRQRWAWVGREVRSE